MIRFLSIRARMRLCAYLLMILGCCSSADATNLTGTFKNPDGSAVNGKLIFLLSQPARLNDQSAQIVPMVKIFAVNNGTLEAGAFVYGNDVLVPGGTYYLVRLVDDNNNLLFEQKWSISGVNLDLGSLTPTTSGVVYSDPLLKNLSTDQSVQGPVSFSAPITAFSLTLNGNLNPGLPDSYDLGDSAAPWRELHAQRWNSQFAVGPSGGIALPPSGLPAANFVTSGGSIPDGTYYFKITYVNRNGETTGSPAVTLVVSGGGGNARVNVSPNDVNWTTGCYGFRVYASNDNVNFYLQTPAPTAADFMTDTWTHYVTMGSGVRRLLGSLTFSGATLPTTNTAAIDPLQVALNASRRVSDNVPFGTLVVPAIQDSNVDTRTVLTTPLVVTKTDHIIGSSSMAGLVNQQSRIVTSTSWADNKLAAVMMFGGDASISNVGIQGQATNALMVLGGVGNQTGNYGGTSIKDVVLRVTDATNTYSAFVGVGILYRLYFDNVSMLGGNALVQYRNASGGLHYYTGGRWDAGGDHFINMVPGWTDPDSGTNDLCGAGGFCNGLSTVVVKNVNTEGGKGILWDVMGLDLTLDTVDVSDAPVQAGTAAIIRMGTDGTITQQGGSNLRLINASGGSSNNAAAGVKVNAGLSNNQTFISLEGRGDFPFGSSTGSAIGVDASNIQLFLTNLTSSTSTANPNATGNAVKMINVPNSSVVVGGGGGSGLVGQGGQWTEFPDRLALNTHVGNNAWDRSLRRSWRNVSGTLNLYASDDTTVTHSWNALGDSTMTRFLSIGASSPTGAAVGTGGIGLGNGKAIWSRNAANSVNLFTFFVNGSDQLEVGTDAGVLGVKIGNGSAVFKKLLSNTATLDFPNTVASTCSDLTMGLTGAADGDPVFIGPVNAAVPAGGSFFAWVNAANTVTVRFCADGASRDPASGLFRVTIVKF